MKRRLDEQPIARTALLAGLAVASTLVAPKALLAETDWYVRAAGGLSYISDDDSADLTDGTGTQNADASFDLGFGVGIAVGRWFSKRWRADLEWVYRSNDIDKVELDDGRIDSGNNYASSTLALNGYYHFNDASRIGRISPYVGAGLAWVNEIDIDLEDLGKEYEDLEDDGFGVQVMGGFSYRQSERLRWDVELKWLYYGEADLDNGEGVALESVDYAPVTLFAGFSYGF